MHTCAYIHTHAHTSTCTQTDTQTYTQKDTQADIHSLTHPFLAMLNYIYVQTNEHTYCPHAQGIHHRAGFLHLVVIFTKITCK